MGIKLQPVKFYLKWRLHQQGGKGTKFQSEKADKLQAGRVNHSKHFAYFPFKFKYISQLDNRGHIPKQV